MQNSSPIVKELLKAGYRSAHGLLALGGSILPSRNAPALNYGGARAGAVGGPLVKVAMLQSRFPQHWQGFNLLYLLSNALYVPGAVLRALAARGLPIVVNQNGVFYPAWHPRGWQRENARMGEALEAASHVLFQSEFCRRCVDKFVGVTPRSWEILHNAVDTDAFSPVPAASRKVRSGPFRLLLSGKIVRSTDYRLFGTIEGLAATRRGGLEVELTVAGFVEPDVLADAKALVARLGQGRAVSFTGSFGRSEAPAIYRAADGYIITKHNDPCPNVVLEALAAGLPVLYLASGGVPELVGPDAGVAIAAEETFDRVPRADPQAIAEGLAQLVAGREAMAVAARRRAVERFALSRWLDRHAAIFAELLEKRRL